MLMKILRAALFRPWELEDEDEGPEDIELVNDGAPDHWEFRMNEKQDTLAVWIPSKGTWLVFADVVVLQQFRAVDPGTLSNWTRYLEVEEVD
jgi:hypothetical protein